ncbi:hypothetical protein CR513_50978, partial [Mucuna pruriens]
MKRKDESNSNNKAEAKSTSANQSWRQAKAKNMLVHLVSNLNQVNQSNLNPTDNTSHLHYHLQSLSRCQAI